MGSEQLADIYRSVEEHINNKHGSLKNTKTITEKVLNSMSKTWTTDEMEIFLKSKSDLNTITVYYAIIEIAEKFNRDYSETRKKKEEMDRQLEGF